LTPIQLIVGLGNPGDQYARTRHNAGAWLVESLAATLQFSLSMESKFLGHYGKLKMPEGYCHFLLPTTYMNKSGLSVKAVAQFYKIPPQAILVAHDELDLPVGDAKLKFAGGHGGHNGLRDIMQQLGSADFYRLRLGIGHPGTKAEVVHYVLHAPSGEERQKIDAVIADSVKVMPLILKGDLSRAMNELHKRKA
jgi:PTH1 family peptidyl-tRNA hydrolase